MTFSELDEKRLEEQIQSLGRECFSEIRDQKLSLLDPKVYTGKLMNWAMEDPDFRVALFRFVDVLPSLEDSASVIRHAQAYFKSAAKRLPGLLQWGLDLDPDSVRAKAAAVFIRRQIASLGQQFIIGDSPESALKKLKKIHAAGMCSTVDLLGEACVSEAEAMVYIDRYIELLDTLDKEVPVNISVKLSALYSKTKPVAFESSVNVLKDRLRKIMVHAQSMGAFVYVDMEDTSKTDITLEVLKSLLMEDDLRDWEGAGFVLQAYLRRTEEDVDGLVEWVRERGTPVAVRLVKGAYWDTETILAKLAGWPVPVWQEKLRSDVTYERISRTLLKNADIIRPAFASHNLRSLVHAIAVAEQLNVTKDRYEFQTLYGMADPIKAVFVKRGITVREYAPVGDMLTGMAYLVRRLLENTANEGFIRSGFLEGESVEELLATPQADQEDPGTGHMSPDPRKEFGNVPLLDFSVAKNRRRMSRSLQALLASMEDGPSRVFPIINGERQKDCSSTFTVKSPEDTSLTVGTVGMAGEEHVQKAVTVLNEGFAQWRERDPDERCEIIYRVADLMEERRTDFAALATMESGKPWLEADGDVAEAIDFLRYYALDARHLFQGQNLCQWDGEEDIHFYEARGVCGVIGPWNFPLAIPCGMLSAALVTGNPVILKPAEQSTIIASRLFDLFLEAGMPPNVAAFLPGRGEVIGKAIVGHPGIDTIVFTGSKEVGMRIIREASVMREGQVHVKRVVAEMGGKNAIVVDDGADLDQAVKGIVYSAFGYAGQKCSACSRLYVHKGIHGRLMERLTEAVRSLVTGRASDPSIDLGPVIDDEAMERLNTAVLESGLEPVQGTIAEGLPDGRYLPATLFPDCHRDHSLLKEELFGPVLAAVKVESFKEGIDLANRHEYGLTGGVFSRHPGHLRQAARDFRVGNLYLNRNCTGALVGRQPFGGFKHSGVGSKTGGPDYLKQFVIPRVVCENTLRQGFAPMEND